MAREFTKNMFIMLLAIMVGAVIITFFVADIVNQSTIETIQTEHSIEIEDIHRTNENFTDHFLQGSIKMDAAREVREVGNYHFDFALFWFSNALANTTDVYVQQCIENCTNAMENYYSSYEKFGDAKPYFEQAMTYTEKEKYIEVLSYYVSFALSGKNITLLRYNASDYLMRAVENLSLGEMENFTILYEEFNLTQDMYMSMVGEFEQLKDQIDGYLFFNEIREEE